MSKKSILLSLAILFVNLNAFGGELDRYDFSWLDPDKEVFVLQNRKFRKNGKIHFNAGFGKTLSGAFVDATTIQARAGYFFKEEFGVEFLYAKNSGAENDTAKSVRNSGSGSGSTPFSRIMDDYTGAMLLWSPFYSKINTFNKIVYMDWIFGLGFAKITETNNLLELDSNGIDKTLTQKSHTGLMWNVGAKFYFTEMWSTRLDLTSVNYQAQTNIKNETQKIWYNNYDLIFSIEASF